MYNVLINYSSSSIKIIFAWRTLTAFKEILRDLPDIVLSNIKWPVKFHFLLAFNQLRKNPSLAILQPQPNTHTLGIEEILANSTTEVQPNPIWTLNYWMVSLLATLVCEKLVIWNHLIFWWKWRKIVITIGRKNRWRRIQ